MTCDQWPVSWPCPTDSVDPARLDAAYQGAISILWALSGGRIGVCTYTEGYWPACACGCCAGPYKDAYGNWRNRGGEAADCCRILLDHRPVQTVSKVVVDGCLLNPGSYFMRGGYLTRIGDCWPCGDPCEPPAVTVEYTAGAPFPALTGVAVGEVACELLKASNGDPCKLPSRAVSVTRQGVTVDLADPSEFLTAGKLGLPMADAWLSTVNPGGLRKPSKVFSPDLPRSTPATLVEVP